MSPRRQWERPRDAQEYAFRVLLANRLREAREHAGMSVRQLAAAVDRPHSHIVDIEVKRRSPRVADLWKIAQATGWPVERFVMGPRDEDEQADWDFAVEDFERGDAAPGGIPHDDEHAD